MAWLSVHKRNLSGEEHVRKLLLSPSLHLEEQTLSAKAPNLGGSPIER